MDRKNRIRTGTNEISLKVLLFSHGPACQTAGRFTQMNTDRLKHKETTDIILKSFYEVYNELGDGFLESVYENALYIVLTGYGLYVER